MFLELYFQLFLISLLIITFVLQLVFSGFIKTYPDLLDNGVSIFKILGSFFSKNKILDKTLSQYDKLNEKFELILNKFYWRSFYLVEIYISLNIIIAYIIYNIEHYFNIGFFLEHRFLTNICLLICSYYLTKLIKRIYNV